MRRDLRRRFWLLHLGMPAALFALVIVGFSLGDWNASIASTWAYDPVRGWIGRGAWWAEDLLHEGGRNVVRAIAALCLLTGVVARVGSPMRRGAFYVFLSIVVST